LHERVKRWGSQRKGATEDKTAENISTEYDTEVRTGDDRDKETDERRKKRSAHRTNTDGNHGKTWGGKEGSTVTRRDRKSEE